ncbi:MAG: hypothetical protein ABL889_13820 [Terricaulis sp.]
MSQRILSAIMFLTLMSGTAFADECVATFSNVMPTIEVSVDPFSPGQTAAHAMIPVNLGDAQCEVLIQFDAVGGRRVLRGAGGELEYRLTTRESGLADRLGGQGTVQSPLRIAIEDLRLVPPGRYEGEVEARLFSLAGGLLDGPVLIHIRANVLPRAQANLAGANAGASYARVDLGTLQSGERARLMLQVRSNTQVTVQLTSQNGSELRLEGAPSAPSIPYELAFDGEANVAGQGFVRSPRLSQAGEYYPIEIVVGPVRGVFAGRYNDIVTVTVTPN